MSIYDITLETSKITMFLHYLMDVIKNINLTLQSLYLLKKPHKYQLRTFKDLSAHRNIETKNATLIYTM